MLQATTERREGGGGGGEHGYAAILAHAEGVLYGMELGSVTLKNKQPTHTVAAFQIFVFCKNIEH